MSKKVIFIPGNGGGSPRDNWFPYLKQKLEQENIQVIAEEFPDNELARESFWVPFIINELGADEDTILVGHSSGALAAMRIAEQHKIHGSVLVGACYTDLGIETEKQSGYYSRPWNWQAIKQNQQWIALFASQDDPWIPIAEARHIHVNLNCEYHEYTNQGHFGGDYYKESFPELLQVIMSNLQN